jgi:predicted phosphodiesterase
MPKQTFAVLSDIHGNRWALEAVLDDIRRRGVRDMVNLGDSLYGPLDPAGTARILLGLDMVTVSGNEDRIILDEPGRHPDSPSLPFVQADLQPADLRWLERLPFTAIVFGDFLLCHGTPENDREYLLREVTARGCRLLPAELVEMKLAAVSQRAVLCGHDHLPSWLRLPAGGHVIDPGSVGLPAYRGDRPFPHVMEAGSPHARYSVVTVGGPDLEVLNVAVAYDWDAAARAAERNGRPDWAIALRSGRAS